MTGEIRHNAGFEGFYKYTGIKGLTLWSGFAYDTKGQKSLHPDKVLTLDFWAEYKPDDKSTVAAEVANYDGGIVGKGTMWLVYYGYNFTEKTSCAFRFSGTSLGANTAGSDYTQYTVCPTYAISKNFSMRAEYSYYVYNAGGSKSFFGVQALLKF